eukprot:CAMPEP_0172840776 /NCGR_PEP_ID=MMETSP1075-20121228/29564_1 /TAXON_ID=2916 /ORGANISM="Ceratium fusus, Strain PA161109" /LENGTH=67 /DNA_ID=CAMNT_0013684669 /DNA_START=245 /DNA_END=448 /DNA_ORIENTATION=+
MSLNLVALPEAVLHLAKQRLQMLLACPVENYPASALQWILDSKCCRRADPRCYPAKAATGLDTNFHS